MLTKKHKYDKLELVHKNKQQNRAQTMSAENPFANQSPVPEPYRGPNGGFDAGDDLLRGDLQAAFDQHNAFMASQPGYVEAQAIRAQGAADFRAQQFSAANRGSTYSSAAEQPGWGSAVPTPDLPDFSQVREGRVSGFVANRVESMLGAQLPTHERQALVYGLQEVGGAALRGVGVRDASGNVVQGGARRALAHPFKTITRARNSAADAAERTADMFDQIDQQQKKAA
jgi:hypothetical protein